VLHGIWLSYQNKKRFPELEALTGHDNHFNLRNQILQIILGWQSALIFKALKVTQGFIFLPAGGALIQVLSHLGHFDHSVLTGQLQFNKVGHGIKALGAGNLMILGLIDILQPAFKTITLHR